MTRDDIINFMNWHPSIVDDAPGSLLSKVERIVRAAEQAEREACAQVCDRFVVLTHQHEEQIGPGSCAAAIRARGKE